MKDVRLETAAEPGIAWFVHARRRGFSLIELVIAVAVVAILAAIALPSYASYLRRSARSEVQSAITDIGARQAQFLLDRRAYATTFAQLGYTLPVGVTSKYNVALVVNAGPPPTFRITATAFGDQAKDTCPALSFDSAGNRTPASCW